MCGIVGIIGDTPVEPLLLDGLKRLEYRGYDSAGIATLTNGSIDRRRAEGKLTNLQSLLQDHPIAGSIGIAHTRWATHGRPSEANAHPHADDRVAVVHNGIIENFQDLRDELTNEGHVFQTETDTEVVVHLISHHLGQQLPPQEAVSRSLKRLEGAFALAIIFAGRHDIMIGARQGSPLAVGHGRDAMYLGSDALALAPLTDQISYLEEGDWVVLTRHGAEIHDRTDQPVAREVKQSNLSGALIGKGEYRHFMLKEIFEQPAVMGDTLQSFTNPLARRVELPDFGFALDRVPRITMTACGTAFYAAQVAKYWLEQVARQPVEIDIASEFRYREAPLPEEGVSLFISQSGETIDTLEALRYARSEGQAILSIINAPESAIARESDAVLPTLAGPEIGVASTKAFTTQLIVLACLSLAVARARGVLSPEREAALLQALIELPAAFNSVLQDDDRYHRLCQDLVDSRDVLYLGRGPLYPIALEGALKLKEISYIHAEGYAAGEMKHGPIALIDEEVPVIFCAPSGPLFDKTASNLQEVQARGGRVILLSDPQGVAKLGEGCIASNALTLPAGRIRFVAAAGLCGAGPAARLSRRRR